MPERTYMIEYRRKNGITLRDMEKACDISAYLLTLLEGDEREVTHPKIAKRVGKAYGLTKEQTEGLMPEHYRKSSPNYNPDLYKEPMEATRQTHMWGRRLDT